MNVARCTIPIYRSTAITLAVESTRQSNITQYIIHTRQPNREDRNQSDKKNVKEECVPVELEGDGERGGGLPRARRAVEQHVRQLRGTKQQIREISKGFLRIETMNLGDRRRVRV